MVVRMPTPKARDAARVLGAQIAAARRRRRWTAERLAEQVNVSLPTLRKIERGDPTAAMGTVLDAAVALGRTPVQSRHRPARRQHRGSCRAAAEPGHPHRRRRARR